MWRMGISGGMQVAAPAAGVFFSLIDERIPLCLTYSKTFNAFVRLFFVVVFLFRGLYFVQSSEPPFGEGLSQTALFIVLFSFLLGMFGTSTLITRSVAAFSLLYFINGCIGYLQLYKGFSFS